MAIIVFISGAINNVHAQKKEKVYIRIITDGKCNFTKIDTGIVDTCSYHLTRCLKNINLPANCDINLDSLMSDIYVTLTDDFGNDSITSIIDLDIADDGIIYDRTGSGSDSMKIICKKIVVINSDDDNNSDVEKIKDMRCIVKMVDLTTDDMKLLNDIPLVTTDNDLLLDDLKFYPNPANSKFTLAFTIRQKCNTEVKIYDAGGIQVYNEYLNNFEGNYTKEIDLTGHNKGTYFLMVTPNGRQFSKKIIIQ